MSITDQPLDPLTLRKDFPILSTTTDSGKPLVYLDNAASTQRPRQVIEAIDSVYETSYANVHRSGHGLAAAVTSLYEASRESVRRFLGAPPQEDGAANIIFTTGTTGAINLVARSWGDANLGPGDEILLTIMEHHSNIVPWQQLAERTGATIRWVPITDDYHLDRDAYERLLSRRTKIVALSAASNVLGTINPVQEMVEKAHAVGAQVLVDAAQYVPSEPTSVEAWNADFVAFSGHKVLGPTGIGALYGRRELLEAMPPFLGGGSMIRTVSLDGFTPAALPAKFEAGTPPIASAIALKAAIDYVQQIGLPRIIEHERRLATLAHDLLSQIEGIRLLGPPPRDKVGIVSFVVDGIHSKDVAAALDVKGIAIREGHHCTMPLHQRLGLDASCRASFYLYNTPAEVELLADGLARARTLFLRK